MYLQQTGALVGVFIIYGEHKYIQYVQTVCTYMHCRYVHTIISVQEGTGPCMSMLHYIIIMIHGPTKTYCHSILIRYTHSRIAIMILLRWRKTRAYLCYKKMQCVGRVSLFFPRVLLSKFNFIVAFCVPCGVDTGRDRNLTGICPMISFSRSTVVS